MQPCKGCAVGSIPSEVIHHDRCHGSFSPEAFARHLQNGGRSCIRRPSLLRTKSGERIFKMSPKGFWVLATEGESS